MTPKTEILPGLLACVLVALAALVACHLWGVQSQGCDPYGTADAGCRAQPGPEEMEAFNGI